MSVQVGDEIDALATLHVVSCCSCGCVYAIPEEVHRRGLRHRTGASIYCPNGHSWHYTGKTHAEEVAELRDQAARDRAARDQAETDARMARVREAGLRKERDRLKARASAGVCPCCNRTFQNVARHMKTKHPDAVEAARAEP